MDAYTARTRGRAPAWTPLPVQYADYTLWQRQLLGSADDPDSLITTQLGYWTDTLAELPQALALPTDRPRPTHRTLRGDRHDFTIDPDLHRRLTHLTREHRASMFMTVHAALAILLARLSGSDDIPIGTPVAGRGDAALDHLVGMFVNTLVLRTHVHPAATGHRPPGHHPRHRPGRLRARRTPLRTRRRGPRPRPLHRLRPPLPGPARIPQQRHPPPGTARPDRPPPSTSTPKYRSSTCN